MRLNLMYVIVWLPAIFFIGRALLYGYSGLVNLSEYQSQMEAGSIAARRIRNTSLSFRTPCVPCCFPRWYF